MTESSKAIFLSYAKEDAEAARSICEALRAAGIEVWFDQSELRGGDVWDAAIRRQIKTCALFVPLISRNARTRAEGYFRLEWKLAVDRSYLMSSDRPYLVPVALDDTPDIEERIPDRFREVQWTRLPGGVTSDGFVERMQRLLAATEGGAPTASGRVAGSPSHVAAPEDIEPRSSRSAGGSVSVAAPAATATPGSAGGRPKWIAAAIAIGLLAAAGIAFTVHRQGWLRAASVAPYSPEDRRMTFAVLTFQSPAGDAHAVQVAQATRQELQADLEEMPERLHVAPADDVQRAEAQGGGLKSVARALDVHFLLRGAVTHSGTGYQITLSTIDGTSQRVLRNETVSVAADALTPRWHDDLNYAAMHLSRGGLEAEVAAARGKPFDALDVRDLTFRAYSDWLARRGADGKGAYVSAADLLKRASQLAPDDPFAIETTAEINLCDCIGAWSKNPEEQRQIGAEAMDKYLRIDPNSFPMQLERTQVYQYRGRWEESLSLADALLARRPDSLDAQELAGEALLHLGRTAEAQVIADRLQARNDKQYSDITALDANVHYAVGDDAKAAQLAQAAAAQLTEGELRNPIFGTIRLTQIAAEARRGNLPRAKAAFADFSTAVPEAKGIAGIRKWMHPSADLAGFEPLFDGLRKAGVPD